MRHRIHNIVQQWKEEGRCEGWEVGRREGLEEGRREGRQKVLLMIYRARFKSVPRVVRAAVEHTRADTTLAKWLKIFVLRSAAEIAAAVAENNA